MWISICLPAETVYPNAVASAVIYGVCTILMLTVASVGCIVGCQCHCCSDNCGPFPDPQYWARLRESTVRLIAGLCHDIFHMRRGSYSHDTFDWWPGSSS